MSTGLFSHRGHNQGRAFKVHRARQARVTINAFADALANSRTGTVTEAAGIAGISPARGYQLFAQIKRELGSQAS